MSANTYLTSKHLITGCFRSDTGTDAFQALHSIADTAWEIDPTCRNSHETGEIVYYAYSFTE